MPILNWTPPKKKEKPKRSPILNLPTQPTPEWGILTDPEAESIGLETDREKLLEGVPRTSSGSRPQTLGDAMRGIAMSKTPNSLNRTLGKTPNSAGSYYGVAGYDSLGTDSAGNTILGTLGGKNVIGSSQFGGTDLQIDRTAGIRNDPMEMYMRMFSPESVIDRQKRVRDEIARERQNQIDAITRSTQEAVSKQEAMTQEDLARQRSINLRAGLGGSDFGAAAKTQIRNEGAKNVRAIQAQGDIAIGSVIDTIDQLANQRFQLEENAYQNNFSNMFQMQEFMNNQRTEAVGRIAELGKAGLDIATIKERDPGLYDNLQVASGMGEVELEAILNNSKPAPARVDYQWKVAGGKIFGYGVDPTTGQLKTIEQEVDMPDGYKTLTADDGTILGIPENWDGDTSKIVTVGNYAKATGGGGTGDTGDFGADIGGAPISEAAQNILQQINLTGGTVEDYVKGTSNEAQNLRNEVYRGLAMQGGGTDKSNEILQSALDVANKMIEANDYKQFGYSSKLGGQFTTKYGDMMMRANQLNAILARDNLGILKGVLSDTDVALIKAMSGGVDTSGTISEEFAKERIEDIQKKISERIAKVTPQQQSISGTVRMLGPDGKQYDVPINQVDAFIADGGKRI